MATANSKVIALLNNLVATCKDGENGYRSAAEEAESKELKDLFHAQIEQRAQFAAELLAQVHRLDVAEERRGTLVALIHRGWINMKAALTRREASAILNECERGERAAARDYEQALKQPLPPEILAVVERQYLKMKETYDRVHALKAITVLNHLIATCKDGEKGYRTALGHVDETDLKTVFSAMMEERAQFASELLAEVHRLGDLKERKGTIGARMHRGWINLKSTFRGHNKQMILRECERGEHTALRHYDEALAQPLPDSLHALVERQHAKVKEGHDSICVLQGHVQKA